jgi:hypothetical protein
VLIDDVLTQAWQRFYSAQGWQLAEDMPLRFGRREWQIKDSVLPSPSAVLYAVSLQYGDATMAQHARAAMLKDDGSIEAQAFWNATQIHSLLLLGS